MFKVASWNLNSVRSRLTHVTAWLKVREPDVLLLQELKGTEFPSEAFKSLGYESVAVTQKAYNGVAILSRHPMNTIAKALVGVYGWGQCENLIPRGEEFTPSTTSRGRNSGK